VQGQDADGQPMRVFVCDDAPEHRALVRALLDMDADLELVGEAADGAECLDGVAATDPDVLVLDLNMPGVDGWRVLDELDGDHPRVLVLSSAFDADDRVRAKGAEFLRKGGPPTELIDAIRRLAA
jgi:DNA-binding NarL/FixJ family response regulator